MILPKRILIVGGNAAGPAAAAKAKRVNPNAEVVLFEAGNFISTGTCEMPYVLSGDIKNYEELIFFSAQSFEEKKNVKVFTNHFVEEIDKKAKEIKVRDLVQQEIKTFSYDALILTTGSRAKTLPQFPTHLKNVFTLKNISDLISIGNFIKNEYAKHAFVIGSGYVGIEVTEALIKTGIEVSLVEKEKLPMPNAETEISEKVLAILRENNVNFIGNQNNAEPIIYNDKVKAVKIDGRFVDTDLVLVAAGFVPDNYLAVQAKLEMGKTGGIKVDKKLKTSDNFIYAAGDNIEVTNSVTGKPGYFPLASQAYNFGRIAGKNAAGGNAYAEPVVKNFTVKIFDKFFAEVGINTNEAQNIRFDFASVSASTSNLVKVMPGSEEVFGKIVFGKTNRRLLGASFLGGNEISGYADLISALIHLKQPADVLTKINYNYTPPLSPFINLLSLLGKKAVNINK